MNLYEFDKRASSEPPQLELRFSYFGYDCAIIKRPFIWDELYRCGYVNITNAPAEKANDDNYLYHEIECHGGITYVGDGMYPAFCDLARPGQKWIGFDCMHAEDRYDPKSTLFCVKELMSIVRQLIGLERFYTEEAAKNTLLALAVFGLPLREVIEKCGLSDELQAFRKELHVEKVIIYEEDNE